jgi:glycosyltransferase involved in cell wall biosynthesis
VALGNHSKVFILTSQDENLDVLFVAMSMQCGGSERVISRITEYLNSRGVRVGILTIADDGDDFFSLPTNVTRYRLNNSNHLFLNKSKLCRIIFTIGAVRQYLKTLNPKKVISFLPTPNVISLIAGVGLKCERVVCERNNPERQKEVNIYWRLLRIFVYPLASIVTVNSHAAERYFRHLRKFTSIVYVRNPPLHDEVKISSFREDVILFVGRLVYQKGLDVLLEALSLTRCLRDGWELHIVGDGPLKQQLLDCAVHLDISDSIKWMGQLERIGREYSSAAIFVLPSRYEGTSNALLEAMLHGLPILTTTHAAADVVENEINGIVIEELSASLIAESIDRLVEDKTLRLRLGRNARQIENEYDYETIMNSWYSICCS